MAGCHETITAAGWGRMRSGRLRHRITIKQKTVSARTSYGEDTYTWTTVGSYWADVLAMQGREMEAVQQTWAEARFKVRMRNNGDTIKREYQITWGSRTFDILDVEDPDGHNKELVLYVKEFVA